ncbi:flagellin [Falsirhodobacter halotolerans]|uniref:flagellin n=1 Tax=Falsirhodobacter halotolerans TaxID=1146892 RepID=UPI001FD47BDF|nr:flagellin [Falsirhodobacter halotolerans]MCJ8140733.1 flagellar biosynthesis protein FlgL [Falsirhodobacter halotolerans]
MSSLTLSDMAQTFALRRQNVALKTEMQTQQAEMVTGQAADPGRALRGDHAAVAALDAALTRNRAFADATGLAGALAAGMQTALGAIDAGVKGLGGLMSDRTALANDTAVSSTAASATAAFRATVAALNTQVAGQSLFAGTRPDGPALPQPDALLEAMETAIAGADGPAGIEAALDRWFADPAGFGALYSGGGPRAPLPLGAGEGVEIGLTAADPALTDTLKALGMAAMVDRGAAGGAQDRADLMVRAGAALLRADEGRTAAAARLGVAEERIGTLALRHDAERTALMTARADMLAVDPFEAATRLEATRTQIETLYAVTARLSKLSLADYL